VLFPTVRSFVLSLTAWTSKQSETLATVGVSDHSDLPLEGRSDLRILAAGAASSGDSASVVCFTILFGIVHLYFQTICRPYMSASCSPSLALALNNSYLVCYFIMCSWLC